MLYTPFQGQTPIPDSNRPRLSAMSAGILLFLTGKTCLLAVRVKEGFEIDDIGVGNQSHDLQFSVLRSATLSSIPARTADPP
jgi:hypothetical protein